MVDVTVRGAGIFGLSIAWACVQRGAKVRVIDPHGPGAGASGGVLGALAPHVPENWNEKKAFQFESLRMAEGFWAEVEAASGRTSGYARLGRLQPIASDRQLEQARSRAVSAARLWAGVAVWRVIRTETVAWAPDSASGWLIHDTLSARVHPAQACRALAAALAHHGVGVLNDGPEQGLVVHATGVADLYKINATRPRQVGTPIKGQAAVLDHDARALPQLFCDGVHVVPHADGTTAVGSTTEREFSDATETDSQLADLVKTVRNAVPALRDAPVLQRWAGLRPRTRSRAPMLGQHPLNPAHFIANGGFKIGFGMAPKVASCMADLMLENRDTIPDGFRPEASF